MFQSQQIPDDPGLVCRKSRRRTSFYPGYGTGKGNASYGQGEPGTGAFWLPAYTWHQQRKGQWEIIMNHMNRNVHVYLKDKNELFWILLDYKMEEQMVKSWRFVSNNNALRYRDAKDESLVLTINDEDIINVENIEHA